MSDLHVQTKREIEGLLARAGLKPRHRFGQHFLIDGNLMRVLVRSAELSQADTVLEVGAGTGGLTDLLAAGAGRVIAVELDRDLFPLLQERFAEAKHVTLIHGDILESKHRLRTDVAESLQECARSGAPVKLVANLPYQVATPLVMNLLTDFPAVRRLCFTVQAEVGERFVAEPNRKTYGPLSILSQSLCAIECVARLRPPAFWPQPSVDSVMLRMDLRDALPIPVDALREFSSFIRRMFEHRRKKLGFALRGMLGAAESDQGIKGIDSSRRPETFTVVEWQVLFRHVRATAGIDHETNPQPNGRRFDD